jgi:hypothetical protein
MVRQMGCALYGESTPFEVRGTPTCSSTPAIVRRTAVAARSSSAHICSHGARVTRPVASSWSSIAVVAPGLSSALLASSPAVTSSSLASWIGRL